MVLQPGSFVAQHEQFLINSFKGGIDIPADFRPFGNVFLNFGHTQGFFFHKQVVKQALFLGVVAVQKVQVKIYFRQETVQFLHCFRLPVLLH